jgi:hypothetical protein
MATECICVFRMVLKQRFVPLNSIYRLVFKEEK